MRRQGAYEDYMELLVNHFNGATLEGLMCRNTISVSHTGKLYDCDFNQMLGLARSSNPVFLWDLDPGSIQDQKIVTGDHCFACTAGSGSSCSGTVI
jgi:hypothetical protein